jgi:hypothetical protein
MDRRIPFFLGSAVVCLLLVPLAEPFAWVAEVTAATYVVLALLVALDSLSRARHRRPPGGDAPGAGEAGAGSGPVGGFPGNTG